MVKNLPANAGDQFRSLGRKDPLEKGLENSMDRGVWWAIVHGIAKSRT